MKTVRPLAAILAVAALATALTACGSDTSSGATGTKAATTSAGFPVTVKDCGGSDVTVDAAPARVVTMDGNTYDLLAGLGVEDTVVATGFPPDPLPEGVTALAPQYPTKEAVIGERPDLVASLFSSAFGEDGAIPRSQLASLGIPAYYALSGCEVKGERRDLELVFTDLENLGSIFGVRDRADALVADGRSALAAAAQDAPSDASERPSVWTYEGTDTPAAFGGSTIANAVMWLGGARNAFADVDGYGEVSKEKILTRDPDIIWIMPEAGVSSVGEVEQAADDIEAKLKKDPQLRTLTAVRDDRFVVISYGDGAVGGPNNPSSVTAMAEAVAQLEAGR